MKVLVCGGAGYIGSHLVREISKLEGYEVVVFDNLSKGHKESVPHTATFEKGDIKSKDDLDRVFLKYRPDAVFVSFALVQ